MNYLSILIAAIASFILGMLWYGPLFGKTWMKLVKIPKSEIKKSKEKGMTGILILNFIFTLIMAFVLSLAITNYGTIDMVYGIKIALIIWLGFIATVSSNQVLWEGKPWKLYFLNNGYSLINLIVMAIIISAMN